MTGITLGNNVYAIGEINFGTLDTAKFLLHESLHVGQWDALGTRWFAKSYVYSTVKEFFKGGFDTRLAYRNNHFEVQAYNYDAALVNQSASWW